jgi:hypothetical protein
MEHPHIQFVITVDFNPAIEHILQKVDTNNIYSDRRLRLAGFIFKMCLPVNLINNEVAVKIDNRFFLEYYDTPKNPSQTYDQQTI